MSETLTYGSYLRLEELLSIQTPRSQPGEHDEMLFIIIHQIYELWFKELLHELDHLQTFLRTNEPAQAAHTTRRILAILKTIVAQLDVLETMTPSEFNAFRPFLGTSSGFQSVQFREIEFVFGYKRKDILNQYPKDTHAREQLLAREAQPTIWDAFLAYLHINGYAVPAEHLNRDVTQPITPSPEIQALLIHVYRSNATARNICENLIDMDEGVQEWRYRHIKMVERTIGAKIGTGGSSGAAHLAATIKQFFPDLWAIRSQL